MKYLVRLGNKEQRAEPKEYKKQPISSKETTEELQLNRRTEIITLTAE